MIELVMLSTGYVRQIVASEVMQTKLNEVGKHEAGCEICQLEY